MSNGDLKRLGDFIHEVDVRNKDGIVTNLVGLSVSKIFIPSIANTIGTDMTKYKVIKHNQFAYVADTSRRGDKIGIALYTEDKPSICSSIYTTFEVDSTVLMSEYLMMWFRRPEFDRYARFHSHGSAREVFDWDEMCDVMLPIPPIEEQREIVARHQAIERRIEINRKTIARLEEAAQAIYRKMFVDGIDPENLPDGWRLGKLEEICETIMAGVIPLYDSSSPYKVLGQKCNNNGDFDLDKALTHIPKANCRYLQFGDILINSTGSGTLGRVAQIMFNPDKLAYDSNMTMVRSFSEYVFYVGEFLSSKQEYFVQISQGSTNQTRLYCSMIRPLDIIIPPNDILTKYNNQYAPIKRLLHILIEQNKRLKRTTKFLNENLL